MRLSSSSREDVTARGRWRSDRTSLNPPGTAWRFEESVYLGRRRELATVVSHPAVHAAIVVPGKNAAGTQGVIGIAASRLQKRHLDTDERGLQSTKMEWEREVDEPSRGWRLLTFARGVQCAFGESGWGTRWRRDGTVNEG
jgi:hypothetical protein